MNLSNLQKKEQFHATTTIRFTYFIYSNLHPGYEEHASDVFLVKTAFEEVIVRSSKMTEEPNNDFWWDVKTFLESIQGTYII